MNSENNLRISLHGVKFYGFHGIMEEEKKLGNTFILNMYVDILPLVNTITKLSETIDYVSLYELVKRRMEKPTPLLETIVGELAESIFNKYSIAHTVYIELTKQHVPISNLEGNMSVSIKKSR